MATIFIPTPLRKFTGNKSQMLLSGQTIGSLFSALEESCPGIREQIYGTDGGIKRYINVFVNGRDIRNLDGEQTTVGERDEIFIVPAMAGG